MLLEQPPFLEDRDDARRNRRLPAGIATLQASQDVGKGTGMEY
jgi:hypothetical protein